MISLATKVVPGLGRIHFTAASNPAANKLFDIVKRWASNTSYPTGSAPSQPPSLGHPEWTAFLKKAKHQQDLPLLFSPSDLQQTQIFQQMEKRLSIVEKMLSEIRESNAHISGDMNRVIQLLTKQG